MRAQATVVLHPAADGLVTPSNVAYEMDRKCRSARGAVGLDLREGTIHLQKQFPCALVRENRSGLEQELVESVENRNDAGVRADLTNTLAREIGVHPSPRADLVWMIGTGTNVCWRIDDVAWHRGQLASSAAHETPLHWTKVEAVKFAGTCPDRLGDFFASVVKAGQPSAAHEVQSELARLGVSS